MLTTTQSQGFTLRPYQEEQKADIYKSIRKGAKRILCQLSTGGGKCLGLNTPVLMFDGTIKMVQDICINDLLMGDDSSARTVLSLARGRENMYRITPVKGEPWECNESHILSLVWNGSNSRTRTKGQVYDISVKDYMLLNSAQKHCLKQFRVGVEYESRPITLDPYYLGAWLGDGTKRNASITNIDSEVTDYINSYAVSLGLAVREERDPRSKAITYHYVGNKGAKNVITEMLKDINVLSNKHIPLNYLNNSKEIRLQLLAGLLDTDGFLHHGFFEIVQKIKVLARQILTLARSLGYAAYVSNKIVNGEIYYRINISGDVDNIPVKVKRRQANTRLQKKRRIADWFFY
jgi:hypothetical protein